jgi:hypothetical protein
MAKPLLVLAYRAIEPFRKLPKVIDELPVQVLKSLTTPSILKAF